MGSVTIRERPEPCPVLPGSCHTGCRPCAPPQFNAEHPGSLGEADRKQKEELEGRVKLLSELDEKYEDLGE